MQCNIIIVWPPELNVFRCVGNLILDNEYMTCVITSSVSYRIVSYRALYPSQRFFGSRWSQTKQSLQNNRKQQTAD